MGGWRVAAAAVALVLLASGCTGPASSAPSPSTPSATTPSSAPASPSPTSNRDRAEASARATVDVYYRVLDEIASDPDVPMSQLDEALAGDYLAAWRSDLEKSRTDGWRQSGYTELIDVVTQGVEAPSGGRSASVVVDVCYDVSATDVVDASGASVVPEDRPSRGWERLTVTNASFSEDPDSGWRVSGGPTSTKLWSVGRSTPG